MTISGYKIKPIALYLEHDEKWRARYADAKEHFLQSGVEDIYWFKGVSYAEFQIEGTGIYTLDNAEKNIREKFNVGKANTANFLSQYAAYLAMDILGKHTDYTHFMYLEDDCRFVNGWKEKLTMALEDIEPDFDFLYVGSCCCGGKRIPLFNERSNLFKFPKGEANWTRMPLCTHCYIVSKKCLQFLIDSQRNCANPTDISLARYALPFLNTFAILPRLANQINTEIPE